MKNLYSEHNEKLPNDIQLILNTREDLLNLNFDKPENELNLCNWLICHGFTEYPYLRKSDPNNIEFHSWLGMKKVNDSFPRIINSLIYLLNKKYKKMVSSKENFNKSIFK